ncbi:MAG: DUF4339 domain-containing protein [Pirellulaceae bacterium]
MAQWYIQVDSKAEGPFTSQDLRRQAKSGILNRADKIRKGEDGEWVAASQVRGLFEVDADGPSHEAASANSEKAEWWYCTGGFLSSVKGPLSASHIRNLARAGKIARDSQVRHESQECWDRGESFPWIFDVSLPAISVQRHVQAVSENSIAAVKSLLPKRQGSLDTLANSAGFIGGAGMVVATLFGMATAFFVLPSESGGQYVGGMLSLVVMLIFSSLLWFIIAGALRAFEHLIRVSEFTAERMVNIERSLQKAAGEQDFQKRE